MVFMSSSVTCRALVEYSPHANGASSSVAPKSGKLGCKAISLGLDLVSGVASLAKKTVLAVSGPLLLASAVDSYNHYSYSSSSLTSRFLNFFDYPVPIPVQIYNFAIGNQLPSIPGQFENIFQIQKMVLLGLTIAVPVTYSVLNAVQNCADKLSSKINN